MRSVELVGAVSRAAPGRCRGSFAEPRVYSAVLRHGGTRRFPSRSCVAGHDVAAPWATVLVVEPPPPSERLTRCAWIDTHGLTHPDDRAASPVPEVETGTQPSASGPSPSDLLEAVLPLLERQDLSPQACLDGIEAVQRLVAALASARLHAAAQLATRTGEELLRRQQVRDPDELSKTRRERWRARTKSATSTQIAALTGWGRGKSRQLVAIALAPRGVRQPVDEGLDAGIATWDQVEQFWREAAGLREEHGPRIAGALFSTSALPADVDAARLDPDGALSAEPWQAQPFVRALRRMLVAARGTDPDADAKDRQARHEGRNALGCVDDDGSGELVITGDAASVAACADRLHLLARRARQAGDPRTQAQLRSDLARSLLLHGTLPLSRTSSTETMTGTRAPTADGSSPGGSDLLDQDEVARLAQIVTGAPTYHLQVLVPWDVLTGRPVLCDRCRGSDGRAEFHGDDTRRAQRAGTDGAAQDARVGATLGRDTLFLTPGALRAAALAPGTTLSRILFDPADGRCIERSVARYRPDRAMREQVLAADLHSRGVGSVQPARDSQLDHVVEYLAGGTTAETNLQALDTGWHWGKTAKEWHAEMDAQRTVTWTSMFERLHRTRSHDYRQYFSGGAVSAEDKATQEPGELRTQERRDLASLLVYAALSAREGSDRLAARDDDPDGDDEIIGGPHRAIWVRRTREADGRKVSGARPGTPTPEQIVRTPPATILRAQHWTDPFTVQEDESAGADAPQGGGSGIDAPPPF